MPPALTLSSSDTSTACPTAFAPLAYLAACYHEQQLLKPLADMPLSGKTVTFTPQSKLLQILVSVLGGCRYLSEVNTRLRPDHGLAQAWGWERFAEQSTLSRSLDGLTQMKIDVLAAAVNAVRYQLSPLTTHDWRGYLWLDYDLSGLPAGKQAQGSTKGYSGGKKTSQDDRWRV